MKKTSVIRRLKTVLGSVLSGILILSLSMGPVMGVYAGRSVMFKDDMEDYGEYLDGDGEDDGDPEGQDPLYEEGYFLTTSMNVLSFGTVTQGSKPEYQAVVVNNAGSSYVNLAWAVTNSNGAFTVDAPSSLSLDSGETCTFYVSVNPTAGTGSYTASLFFYDAEDYSYQYATYITLSASVIEAPQPTPYVTDVVVSPANSSVAKGTSARYSAEVRGGNGHNTNVTWSVSGNRSSGTCIDGNGDLYVASDEGASTLSVTATSVQNPSVASTVTVIVTDTDYTLSLVAEPQGAGSVSGGGTIASGGSMAIIASPNAGYQFIGWYLDDKKISDQPNYTVTNIKSNMTLKAKFQNNSCYVTVKKNHNSAGDVTSSQSVPYNGSLTLSAKPKDGYHFDGWVENNNTISRDSKITLNNITSNREIIACFSQVKFDVNLSISPQDTGKIYGGGTYAKGTNIIIKAEAYDGFVFKNWTLNGNVVTDNAEYTIKDIKQDYNLVANFEKKNARTYKITASVCTNDGTITPSGETVIQEGGSQVYMISPKPGYKIQNVAIDGKQVGAVSSYSFKNITGNHSIVVAFEENKNAVVKPAESGKKAATTVEKTDTVTPAKAQSDESQLVADITAEDIEQLEEAEVMFEDENEDYNYDEQVGVLQILNITEEEAKENIAAGNYAQYMETAAQNGFLKVSIMDEYSTESNVAVDGLYVNTASLPNIVEVIGGVLTDEDKLDIVKGKEVKVNVNIYDNTKNISKLNKNAIDSYAERGVSIGNYFEMFVMKTKDGNSELVSELKVPMTVKMDIPKDLRKPGRTFYIIRSHQMPDGNLQVSMLEDEDQGDDFITYTTDRFSSYAIAYIDEEGTNLSKVIVISLASVLAVLALVVAIVLGTAPSRRRARIRKRK